MALPARRAAPSIPHCPAPKLIRASDTISTMRALLLLSLASALFGAGALSVFGRRWDVVDPSDWKVESQDGSQVLKLLTPRGPLPGPRRPIQFALAQTKDLQRVKVELDMRPRALSLIIVFAYRDPDHFDYAHLSTDTATKQPHHNGVFHIFDGERVRISSVAGRAAFPQTNHWYHVVLNYDGGKGSANVSVDGLQIPALHAVDLSLSGGKVGLGSFDEVGDFKNVQISPES
jgi:hypothetical protein